MIYDMEQDGDDALQTFILITVSYLLSITFLKSVFNFDFKGKKETSEAKKLADQSVNS